MKEGENKIFSGKGKQRDFVTSKAMLRKQVLKTEMIKGDFQKHLKENIVEKNVVERTHMWDIQKAHELEKSHD